MVFTGFIFLFSGLVQGLTGFGSALVAIPLLSFFLDIKVAIPLCILNSLIITSYLSQRLYQHMEKRKLTPLCIATIPGILLGTYFFKKGDSQLLSLIFGILLIVYGLYNLFSNPQQNNIKSFWSYIAGFFSGLIGAILSTGGPPVIIYTLQSGWKKDEIKATLTGYFFFTATLTALAHLLTGIMSMEIFSLFMITAPCVLMGTITGSKCYDYFKNEAYLRLINLFLIIMGILMVSPL